MSEPELKFGLTTKEKPNDTVCLLGFSTKAYFGPDDQCLQDDGFELPFDGNRISAPHRMPWGSLKFAHFLEVLSSWDLNSWEEFRFRA